MSRHRPLRSLLFLPATRLERLDKALGSGASAVCIDLEDAVEAAAKASARDAVVALLGSEREVDGLVVRINSPRGAEGLRDLLALIEAPRRPPAVMIPKAESAEEVRWVEGLFVGGAAPRLLPLIETARGIEDAVRIVAASPAVAAVMLGGVDLSADLGAVLEWDSLLYARSRIVAAAAAAGIATIDSVFLDVHDDDGLRAECRRARRMGFTGKALIHPRQVGPVREVFTPTPEEVERARRVVDAYERAGGAATLLDGRLVELPVLRSAQRTLADAVPATPLPTPSRPGP